MKTFHVLKIRLVYSAENLIKEELAIVYETSALIEYGVRIHDKNILRYVTDKKRCVELMNCWIYHPARSSLVLSTTSARLNGKDSSFKIIQFEISIVFFSCAITKTCRTPTTCVKTEFTDLWIISSSLGPNGITTSKEDAIL
jgi:hypothetical protein